ESARKRVFLVLAFFAVALLVSSLFLPAMDLAARVKLVQGWGLKSMGLFGALIAIFLAGASLPEDIEDRKLFTLLTKPIGRLDVVLGKIVGFAVVEAVFYIFIAAMCLVYIRGTVAVSADPGKESVLQFRDHKSADSFSFMSAEDVKSWGAGKFNSEKLAGAQHELTASVGGMSSECFQWRFTGLRELADGEVIEGQMTLKVSTEGQGNYGGVVVRYVNPITNIEDTRQFHVTYNRPIRLTIPAELVRDRDVLVIGVSPTDPAMQIETGPAGVFLWTAPGSFEWNFAKSVVLLFLQAVLLIVATVMGSTLLSAPVNMFFGFFVFVAGSLVAFLRTSISTVESTIAMINARSADPCFQEELPVWMLQSSKQITEVIIRIIPDLTRFDSASYIIKDLNIPFALITDGLAYGLVYTVAFVVLSWLFIRLREFT
ncbi:MAG: hypothetical protein RDV41_06640, partial [Planctomycetota bacterium]|nr:hypothetical protein [Planctomycetota bacterium]